MTTTGVALIGVVTASFAVSTYMSARNLIGNLRNPETMISAVPSIVERLQGYHWLVRGELKEMQESKDESERLKSGLVLVSEERPQAKWLLDRINDHQEPEEERRAILEVLIKVERDRPGDLTALIRHADSNQLRSIVARLRELNAAASASEILRSMLDELPVGDGESRARVAAALMLLDTSKFAWKEFRAEKDPSSRTELIRSLSELQIPAKILSDRLVIEEDASIRQGLILALGGFHTENWDRGKLVERLIQLYGTSPDSGEHAAIEWLMDRWERRADLPKVLGTPDGPTQRGWYVNPLGMTMAVIRTPKDKPFRMGSPEDEAGRQTDEVQHDVPVTKLPPFDLATHEVTVDQFLKFLKYVEVRESNPENKEDLKSDEIRKRIQKIAFNTGSHPVVGVTWYEATRFCNWLSTLENLEPCYERHEPPDEFKEFVFPLKFVPSKNGYRLPTEAEWEYACRAGSETPWPFGRWADGNLGDYACFAGNRKGSPAFTLSAGGKKKTVQGTYPVGSKKPNAWGLFDVIGNAFEWTEDLYGSYQSPPESRTTINKDKIRVLRGGAFDREAGDLRSAYRDRGSPSQPDDDFTNGFRPARSR